MILTNRAEYPSARLLRDAIEKESGTYMLVTGFPERARGLKIRYGCSAPIERGRDTVFNSPEDIAVMVSKSRFSRLLREHDLPTPIFYQGRYPSDFPVLIRESLSSFGGRGIHVADNSRVFENLYRNAFWWTTYIPTIFELRVHVLGGKIAKVFKKVSERPDELMPIRNITRGYHFSLVDNNKYPKVEALVKTIGEFFKPAFYALDIGWDSRNKEYFIFEANSAPGLNENTAELYAKFLCGELNL